MPVASQAVSRSVEGKPGMDIELEAVAGGPTPGE